MDSSTSRRADALKLEGNALFGKGRFKPACRRYTQAIRLNSKNAIYFTNRAACWLGLKEFFEARSDATQATQLDPSYAKAWQRLAAANYGLQEWQNAIEAFEKTLSLMPTNPEIAGARQQYANQIENAGRFLREGIKPLPRKSTTPSTKSPWVIADKRMSELRTPERVRSSAWVLWHAHREHTEGLRAMTSFNFRLNPSANGGVMSGTSDALIDISNGLLRDVRVISTDIRRCLELQIASQTDYYRGNLDTTEDVKADLIKMVKEQGWKRARDSLGMTVRIWLIRGFIAQHFEQDFSKTYEYFSCADEMLTWGCKVWHGIPIKDKGAIFEWTFIRGVKRYYLESIHLNLGQHINDERFTVNDLLNLSRDLLVETDMHPATGELDPGFYHSFWTYPKADALGMMGWSYHQLGRAIKEVDEACSMFSKASEHYFKGAKTFPVDEDLAISHLVQALLTAYQANKPMKDIIPIIEFMEEVESEVYDFFGDLYDYPFRLEKIAETTGLLESYLKGKSEGKYTEMSILKPKSFKKEDKWAVADVVYL